MAKTITPTSYIPSYAITGTGGSQKIEFPVASLADSLSEAEAAADMRKVLFALLQTINDAYTALAADVKPANMTIRKVSFAGDTTVKRQFVVEFTNSISDEDVAAEA